MISGDLWSFPVRRSNGRDNDAESLLTERFAVAHQTSEISEIVLSFDNAQFRGRLERLLHDLLPLMISMIELLSGTMMFSFFTPISSPRSACTRNM